MKEQAQLELDRASETNARRQFAAATIKTILLHVQNDSSLEPRINAALALARSCRAHLSCVHVTPVEAYVAFDAFGGSFVMTDVLKKLDQEEQELRVRVENRLATEDVNWDYEQVTGPIDSHIIRRGALADLIVTGRMAHRSDSASPAVGLLGHLIFRSRTPLFIPSDDGRQLDPTGAVLIAWDGSCEAANAVRSSVGLLKLASSVHVLQINEKDEKDQKDGVFPGTRLLEYLSRHDVHAELSVVEAGADIRGQAGIFATLADRALTLGVAYLVMGGYNHSRLGEYIFGGVTRSMLSSSPVPILIAR